MTKQTGSTLIGIAAIITALGGVVGLFVNQRANNDRQTMTMQSLYAVLEYRLGVVEKACNVPTPVAAPARALGGVVGDLPTKSPERAAAVRRFRLTPEAPASFAAIQQHVQTTGTAWSHDSVTDEVSSEP